MLIRLITIVPSCRQAKKNFRFYYFSHLKTPQKLPLFLFFHSNFLFWVFRFSEHLNLFFSPISHLSFDWFETYLKEDCGGWSHAWCISLEIEIVKNELMIAAWNWYSDSLIFRFSDFQRKFCAFQAYKDLEFFFEVLKFFKLLKSLKLLRGTFWGFKAFRAFEGYQGFKIIKFWRFLGV